MPFKLLFTSAAQRRHTGYTRWLIGRMDAVVATSGRSGSFLTVPHAVVMHGIDTELFHPSSDGAFADPAPELQGRHIIGATGRIRHQKGTDLLIDAMVSLLPHYPDWTAIITGRTTAEHQSFLELQKKKIADAGLQERIVFVGEVDDIRPWYQRFSLLVAPSRNEGFGLTPLEAMASGTAVVASDAGAYAEMIVPGRTGMVVPANDGEALRNAIEPYLADPDRAKRHGENALAHVREHFSIANEVSGLQKVYEMLFAGKS